VGTKVPMSHEGSVSEKATMGMQWVRKCHWSMRDLSYTSSVGTLTCVKQLEMMCECACATVPERFTVADCFFSFLIAIGCGETKF
jgi:hypothetical protein